MNPDDRRYSKEHEWVKKEGGDSEMIALIGITHYAQDQLGDVVYLELPKVGSRVEQHQKLGEVESVKAVSDIFSPVTGTVVEANGEVVDHPEVVNEDPYHRGWLLKVMLQNPSEVEELLTMEQYEAFLGEGAT